MHQLITIMLQLIAINEGKQVHRVKLKMK